MWARAIGAFFAVFVGAGCEGDGTTLVVDLRTDFAAGIEFVAARTEIVDDAGTATRTTERAALATTDFRDGARIAELGELDPGAISVRVRLLDGRGTVVAEKSVRVAVRGRLAVTVVIARACPTGTCATCATNAECIPTASCAEGACTDGMCLFFARSGACAPPLYCDPEVGCVEPPGSDAGPAELDAGADTCGGCPPDERCDIPTGMCVRCGLDGEVCCEGDLCALGRVCRAGTCNSCGGNGEPCCADRACTAGRICRPDDLCQDCGGTAQPCCAGDTCDPGLACGFAGACEPCGGRSEPCCAGDACDGALTCMSGVCTP